MASFKIEVCTTAGFHALAKRPRYENPAGTRWVLFG